QILEEIQNRNSLGYLFGGIGRIYARTGEMAKGEKYYLKAVDLLKNSPVDLQMYLTGLGSIKMKMGDKNKARDYYEQALTINRNLKSKEGTADSLVSIAQLSHSEEDIRTATQYLEQLSKDYKKNGNALGQLSALGDLEDLYNAQNDVSNT